MKIAIISPMKLPIPPVKGGGVENLIQLLIDENEHTNITDIDLTIISPYDEIAQQKSLEYRHSSNVYIDINKRISKIIKKTIKLANKAKIIKLNPYCFTAFEIARKINLNAFDKIIVVNNLALIAALMKRHEGYYILHLHNDIFNANRTAYVKWVKKCQKIITVSNYIKNQVLTVKGICDDSIVVLNNCIDLEKFENKMTTDEIAVERSKYGILANDTVLLYSGRIVREKGVLELISACKDLVEKYPIKILLVGGSWYSSSIKSEYIERIIAEAEAYKDKIIFTGFVDYTEMPKIYTISDISIVPTLFVEDAAPLVVIESLTAGLPLIVTDSGGIPEYVSKDCSIILKRDGDFIEKLTHALEELIINEHKRNEMGKNSRIRGMNYSRINYFRNFVEIINS